MATTITIYRLKNRPDRLFAHCVRTDRFEMNGVAVLDAEIMFTGAIESDKDTRQDRENAKRFALSEHRWPFTLPIVWDDTNEAW